MLYPLKFKPLLKERIWGGSDLRNRAGVRTKADVPIGESWEISGFEDEMSVVAEGRLKGNSIGELTEVFMGELVGDKVDEAFGCEFPLLVKYIDGNVKFENEKGFIDNGNGCNIPDKIEQPGYSEKWKRAVAADNGNIIKVVNF